MEKKARELEKLVRRDPANLAVRLQLAGAYVEIGRIGDAIEQYRAVANAYRGDGRAREAAAVAREGLALAPGDAELARLVAGAGGGAGFAGDGAPARGARVLDAAVAVRELEPMRPSRRADTGSGTGTGTGPTPLPGPLAYHEADPSRIRATLSDPDEELTSDPARDPVGDLARDSGSIDIDMDIDTDIATRSLAESGEATDPATAGLAMAARRISQSLITEAPPAPLEGEDLAAELETRRRPRLDPRDLDKLGLPALEPLPDEEPTNPPGAQPGFEAGHLSREVGRLDDDAWIEEPTDPRQDWDVRPPSGVFDAPLGVTVQSLAPDGSPLTAHGGLAGLPGEVRARLLAAGAERTVKAGEAIVTEGEPGESVFVIQAGEVRVLKRFGAGARPPVEVARLGPGSLVGEIAVMTDRRRHATVVAIGAVKVVEVPRAAIAAAAEQHAALAELLAALTRARLASNLISIAPFFTPLGIDERAKVLARFEPRKFAAGASVIAQGRPAHGLFLVLLGGVEVSVRRADGSVVAVATLGEGAHVGELALMQDGPEPATVKASAGGAVELVVLPSREFYQVVADHPNVWTALRTEAERRRAEIAAAMVGKGGGKV